jgi:hypothetical protein
MKVSIRLRGVATLNLGAHALGVASELHNNPQDVRLLRHPITTTIHHMEQSLFCKCNSIFGTVISTIFVTACHRLSS